MLKYHRFIVFVICSGLGISVAITSGNFQPSDEGVRGPPPVNSSSSGLSKMMETTLLFAMKPLGMIECEGANSVVIENFYEKILGSGINYNHSDYLCGPTCRGKCISRPADVGIPPSIYPFGCKCSQYRCDKNGPIVAPLSGSTFRIVCRPEPRCICVGMGPGQFRGHACQFVNSVSSLPVTYVAQPPSPPPSSPKGTNPLLRPNFLPLRWCSCCPLPLVMKSQ